MHTQYSIIYNSTNWQNVKDSTKLSPQFDTISSFALVIKAVHPVNRLAFMISSKQEEVSRVLNFVRHQQANCFNTLFASINVVSNKEKLLVIIGTTSNIEESEKVKILAVNITKYFDWGLQFEQHILLREYFGGLFDEELDSFLIKFYGLTPLTVFNLRELRNNLIQRIGFLCIPGRLRKRQLIILINLKLFLNFCGLILS